MHQLPKVNHDRHSQHCSDPCYFQHLNDSAVKPIGIYGIVKDGNGRFLVQETIERQSGYGDPVIRDVELDYKDERIPWNDYSNKVRYIKKFRSESSARRAAARYATQDLYEKQSEERFPL